MEINAKKTGKLLIEGKTKQVFELDANLVLIRSKDRITAGDGLKSHEMKGKAVLSTQTNAALFEFLNSVGISTHYVSRVANSNADHEFSFVAKKCAMIPIEWVSRRVATGSFLKRHPNVQEGHRFSPPKLETFFKDDANHDPFWSRESLVAAKLELNGLLIDESRVQQMFDTTRAIYRNLDAKDIDEKAISLVKEKFEVVAQRTRTLFSQVIRDPNLRSTPEVALMLGSQSDRKHADAIVTSLHKYGVHDVAVVVSSAHRTTQNTLDALAKLQQWPSLRAIVAVAGLSNGLGPVLGGNACVPVINCPPVSSADALSLDVWSSIRMPPGIACSTLIGAENAALAAALIVGTHSPWVWSRVRAQQLNTLTKILLLN
ncbi:unnamed protein product [Medioppia subpectinata]|uniref:PurE domain-containing protein n=1 Tax=Medioppia subpectinata TaxID=1979941 RepID=A0A7R9KFV1_9ACAR|nr:unnamed protein product [Medioppia subpectinata]CAG2101799.1 unnamed protein product [Medioppia subpectinata]